MCNINKNVIFRTSFKEEDGGGQFNFVMSSKEFLFFLYDQLVSEVCRESRESLIEDCEYIVGLTMKTWSDDSLSGFIVEWSSGEKTYFTFKAHLRTVLDYLAFHYSCA